MSGNAHVPYLLASLYTLRKHYHGDVWVYAWEESYPMVKAMSEDPRLAFTAQLREPDYRGKNAQFLDKIKLVSGLCGKVDIALYLDADTTIHGSLTPLFEQASIYGFCATQFCDWTVRGSIPRKRIKSLMEFPSIDRQVIRHTLACRFPSLNGGVWAAEPSSPVLPQWHKWTWEARKTFIADEKVLHLMPVMFPEQMTVMLGGAFNCSPMQKFQPDTLYDDQVVVRHYHGDSNVRLNKCQRGIDMWWPIYLKCLTENIGGVLGWKNSIENNHLKALEKSCHGTYKI